MRDALRVAPSSSYAQRIHGLCVVTDRLLPGLAQERTPAPADVTIAFGSAPLQPHQGERLRYRSESLGAHDAALTVFDRADGTTAFRYSDGTSVVIDQRAPMVSMQAVIAPGQTLDDFVAYLYGPVLGFVLRTRGRLALHASAVVIDERAMLLVGRQGAGKSTTAAALVQRGALSLSDDLTVIIPRGEPWYAEPAFDFLRVWPESEVMLFGRAGVLPALSPTWNKLRVSLTAGQRATGATSVSAIVLLGEREHRHAPRLESVAPRDAVIALATNSYSNYLLTPVLRAQELAQLGALTGAVPVLRVVPHADSSKLPALCDLLATAVNGMPRSHAALA